MDVRDRFRRAVLRVYPHAGDLRRALRGDAPRTVVEDQERLSNTDRRQARRLDDQARRIDRLEREVRQAQSRIKELTGDLAEARRLNKRVAELTDIVAEVLMPDDQRDDAAITARLTNYETSL